MTAPGIFFYEDDETLAGSLAGSIAAELQQAKKPFLILPGGRSPRRLISKLAEQDVDWRTVTITTTDERCVPLEDEASNAGQIRRLFQEAGKKTPLMTLWPEKPAKMGRATVTVLGMGTDGHIASLFPGGAMPPGPARISLTMEEILNTDRLILLVAGADKWLVCREAMAGERLGLPVGDLMVRAGEKLEIHVIDRML